MRDVAAEISALGFCIPIPIGKNNRLIEGGVRLEAAKLLGLDRVPCLRIDHLSENEERLLGLAVNWLGEKGQWDSRRAQDRIRGADRCRRGDRDRTWRASPSTKSI